MAVIYFVAALFSILIALIIHGLNSQTLDALHAPKGNPEEDGEGHRRGWRGVLRAAAFRYFFQFAFVFNRQGDLRLLQKEL